MDENNSNELMNNSQNQSQPKITDQNNDQQNTELQSETEPVLHGNKSKDIVLYTQVKKVPNRGTNVVARQHEKNDNKKSCNCS